MEEGFFLEGTGQVSFFSISVNFSVLTKSLRSGEKKGFLALCFYGPGNKVTLTMISPEVLASSSLYHPP